MINRAYELEHSLIGSFLVGGLTSQAREVIVWLTPEMFSVAQFGTIYSAIKKQAVRDNLIDMVMLDLDFNQDLGTLAEIARDNVTYANLSGYAQKVKECWIQRTAQKTMVDLAKQLEVATSEQAEALTNQALHEMKRLLVANEKVKPIAISDLADSYVDVLERRMSQDKNERLLYTGIQAVDELIGGINSTDITIIAGRPAMGKTEFALTVTKNIAQHNGSVLFFSLEMGNHQLLDRIVSADANVPVKRLRNPKDLNELDFHNISNTIGDMKDRSLYFVDRGGLSANEIVAITEQHLDSTGPLSAIVIDYLGLMDHGNVAAVNKTQLIEETLKTLKTFAKNFNVPVILLSQLNREVDKRGDKRPMASDLKDSGAIEQDASQIIFLYRERAYNKDSDNDYSEAIIAKNRFGENGTAYMRFENGHFVECDQATASNMANAPANNKKEFKGYGAR